MEPKQIQQSQDHNGWTDLVTKYVSSVSAECERYAFRHSSLQKRSTTTLRLLHICLIIIPILQLIAMLLRLQELLIGFGCGLHLGLSLVAVNKIPLLSERCHRHRLLSDKYMKLNGCINEQLVIPTNKRYDAIVFENWARQVLFRLKESEYERSLNCLYL